MFNMVYTKQKTISCFSENAAYICCHQASVPICDHNHQNLSIHGHWMANYLSRWKIFNGMQCHSRKRMSALLNHCPRFLLVPNKWNANDNLLSKQAIRTYSVFFCASEVHDKIHRVFITYR